MASRTLSSYGSWQSHISPESLVKDMVGLGNLRSNGDSLFWLERRAHEGGREVIVEFRDSKQQDVFERPYSSATRVHEYGGGSYCVGSDAVYFVNRSDQNINEVMLATRKLRQITTGDSNERFADLEIDSEGECLYVVRERHSENSEPVNDLVRIDVKSGAIQLVTEGHDFYAAPRLSPDNKRLAFICWDHPNMPFNGTQLMIMELPEDSQSSLEHAQTTLVCGSSSESVLQPVWMSNNRLLFSSDRTDFWNLHIYDETGIYCVVEDAAEYSSAQWSFGSRDYVPIDDRFIVARRNAPEESELVMVDSVLNVVSPLCDKFSSFSSITSHQGKIVFIGGKETDYNVVAEFDPRTSSIQELKNQSAQSLPQEWISKPEKIVYPNKNDEVVYAYYYAPNNPDFEAGDYERPPLLVMSHGGPTGGTNADLSLRIQFYTSRGWAVLDVDYGGSTGYGRKYRERLNGTWGITDVVDCESGVRHLIGLDLIDPRKVAIVGGSAGGYTTLRALTTSSLFSAGASHYGVADVRMLINDTHKFESRYVDQLIPENEIDARSPSNYVDQFRCPVVFFQGDQDFVVPKSQARTMFDAIKSRGIFTALFIYEGEGHGFRKSENIQTTIVAQYRFFAHVFGFETPDIEDTCFNTAEVANEPWN